MTKTTDFSAVIASVPVNTTAARVLGGGTHYEPARKPLSSRQGPDVRASVDPIPVSLEGQALVPYAHEIVGRQFGRWRVIGYAAQQPRSKSGKASWVVKCSCGRYETRTRRAIQRAPESGDCCWECMNFKTMKRRYRDLGSAPLKSFTGGKA